MAGKDHSGNGDREADRLAPEFELRDARVSFGGVAALRGVDLTVERGDLHCLTGPNGSGKTTLLSVLLGLRRLDGGTVERRPPSVGCSFQRPSVYPGLTVAENLRVFAAFGDASEDWLARLRSALGLDAVADRRVNRLSGGYRVLLDVALAFVGQPASVLLDEPLRSLDDRARDRLVAFLAEYHSPARTVLVSTHRLEPFEPGFDRVTVLEDGEVVLDERPDGSGETRRES